MSRDEPIDGAALRAELIRRGLLRPALVPGEVLHEPLNGHAFIAIDWRGKQAAARTMANTLRPHQLRWLAEHGPAWLRAELDRTN